jgi:hypothetical protein
MRTAVDRRFALALLLAWTTLGACACSLGHRGGHGPAEAELYATTPLANSVLYHHRWPGFPCYSLQLPGQGWELLDSSAARARWSKGDQVLSIYFTDNRVARFSHVIAPSETVLRGYLGYELSYVRPSFAFPETDPPRFANDDNGAWMQWGWQGLGGLEIDGRAAPADQRHVIANLWVDPWVMSFDWATERFYSMSGPTPAMIDVLDSLEFDPTCNR